MARYRKKPVEITAVKLEYTTQSQDDIIDWARDYDTVITKGPDGGLNIPTLEGVMKATTGDYIIKGVAGEFYPCKPEIFEQTYERIN